MKVSWQVIKIAKLGKTYIHLEQLRVTLKWLVNWLMLWMTSHHVLTCFLPLIANCSVMLESSELFIINAIIILYTDLSISAYLFLHLSIGKFGITKNTDPLCKQRAISFVNWNDLFSKKTAYEKVKGLNSILLNILYLEILFLIRLSNSTLSILTGWILRLLHTWEI